MNTNHTNNNNGKLIFPKLSYVITGLCFEIHNSIGRYAREKQYCNALDFVVDDKIILEVKAKRAILKEDYYQIQRYLQILNLKLGLLINFRNRYLKPTRVIRIDTDNRMRFI